MKFSMRLHGSLPATRCVELAKLAEDTGFETIWFAENPFNRGVWPAMTACLLATNRIAIGPGVFNPYNRHPTLMAMEIAAFDELAQGRTVIGIGSGIADRVVRSGLSYAKPIAALRDTTTILRGLLRGETVTYAGAVFSCDQVRLECPLFRPDIPIAIAATGDQALRLAGKIANGVMISNMSPPGFTARARTLTGDIPIIQYIPCVLRDDAVEARAIVRATIAELLLSYWRNGATAPLVRTAMVRESNIPWDEFAAAMDRLAAGEPPSTLDDRYVDSYSIAGDTTDFHAGVERFAAAGVTELVLTLVGQDPERTAVKLKTSLK